MRNAVGRQRLYRGLYRLLCFAFALAAIWGFFKGKDNFHYLLVASLISSVAAGDVRITRALMKLLRVAYKGARHAEDTHSVTSGKPAH
jgi:hypothetical protein